MPDEHGEQRLAPAIDPDRPPAVAGLAGRRGRILAALGRLSAVRSTELLRTTAARELVEACGFTRAMISAVRGPCWVPLTLHTRHDLDPRATEFLAYVDSDAEVPLANMLAETDVVRRRTASLVDEHLVQTRASKPIIEVARSPAYVVAPILADGRTIGFMHADRVGQPRSVDEDDRRCIQAFTAELAVQYQCASWTERVAERSGGHWGSWSARPKPSSPPSHRWSTFHLCPSARPSSGPTPAPAACSGRSAS